MNLPNKITTFRMICVIFLVAILLWPVQWATIGNVNGGGIPLNYLIALIIFIIASISDAVDGHIARKYNMITDYGKFMDPIADKLLVNSTLICCCYLSTLNQNNNYVNIPCICVILMIGRDIIVDAVRMNAVRKNIVIPANIYGKLKTVIQMVALIFILGNDFLLSNLIGLPNYLKIGQILIYLATVTSLISGVIYLVNAKDVFSEMK